MQADCTERRHRCKLFTPHVLIDSWQVRRTSSSILPSYASCHPRCKPLSPLVIIVARRRSTSSSLQATSVSMQAYAVRRHPVFRRTPLVVIDDTRVRRPSSTRDEFAARRHRCSPHMSLQTAAPFKTTPCAELVYVYLSLYVVIVNEHV